MSRPRKAVAENQTADLRAIAEDSLGKRLEIGVPLQLAGARVTGHRDVSFAGRPATMFAISIQTTSGVRDVILARSPELAKYLAELLTHVTPPRKAPNKRTPLCVTCGHTAREHRPECYSEGDGRKLVCECLAFAAKGEK